MTRKHFEALASNIRAIQDPAAREAAAVAVAAACRYSSGNPRFNIAQFYEACGVPVDLPIQVCPPTPAQLMEGLLSLLKAESAKKGAAA